MGECSKKIYALFSELLYTVEGASAWTVTRNTVDADITWDITRVAVFLAVDTAMKDE